jgi:hypothetical protein
MSVINYLIDYEKWNHKTCTIEYNSIERNKFVILAKISIDSTQTSYLLGKVSTQGDNAIMKFMTFKLVDLDGDSTELKPIKNDEGVFTFSNVNGWSGKNLFKVNVKAGARKMLIIEACPAYNSADGS